MMASEETYKEMIREGKIRNTYYDETLVEDIRSQFEKNIINKLGDITNKFANMRSFLSSAEAVSSRYDNYLNYKYNENSYERKVADFVDKAEQLYAAIKKSQSLMKNATADATTIMSTFSFKASASGAGSASGFGSSSGSGGSSSGRLWGNRRSSINVGVAARSGAGNASVGSDNSSISSGKSSKSRGAGNSSIADAISKAISSGAASTISGAISIIKKPSNTNTGTKTGTASSKGKSNGNSSSNNNNNSNNNNKDKKVTEWPEEEKIKRREERLKQEEEKFKKEQEEVKKQQEEIKKQQDEVKKQQEEIKKQQDEVKKQQDEIAKKQEELAKKDEELKKREEELNNREQQNNNTPANEPATPNDSNNGNNNTPSDNSNNNNSNSAPQNTVYRQENTTPVANNSTAPAETGTVDTPTTTPATPEKVENTTPSTKGDSGSLGTGNDLFGDDPEPTTTPTTLPDADTTTKSSKSGFNPIPIAVGLGAAVAGGVGVKAYKNHKQNSEFDDTNEDSFTNGNRFWTDDEPNVVNSEQNEINSDELFNEQTTAPSYSAVTNQANNSDTWSVQDTSTSEDDSRTYDLLGEN